MIENVDVGMRTGVSGVEEALCNRIININRMELGVLPLLKLTALAGLTLLSFFKAKKIIHNCSHTHPISQHNILTPLPTTPPSSPIQQKHTQHTDINTYPMTYAEFVRIYSKENAGGSMEVEWEDDGVGELEEDIEKSDQFSTMGGETRRETTSIPSDDFPSDHEEECFSMTSTPYSSLRQAFRRQWLRRTKCLKRPPHSAAKPKNRIRKDHFSRSAKLEKE